MPPNLEEEKATYFDENNHPPDAPSDEPKTSEQPDQGNIFNWRDHIPALISLLLLLLLIIGLYLNYRYSDTGRVAAIDTADARIEQLWGAISQRAEQCQPSALAPELDAITPEVVERGLQQEGVFIGESLNVSLAWASRVDLDLAVTEPSGTLINFEHRVSSSSGKLDIDANQTFPSRADCKVAQGKDPVENISWDRPAPRGTYKIEVYLFSLCAISKPGDVVHFSLIVTRAGEHPQTIQGQVSSWAPTFVYTMKLP